MANDTALGPVPEQFDPAKMYRVQLSEAVEVYGFRYVPGAKHTVNGELAQMMREKLVAASEA